jgi:hypothetical protein
MLMRRNKITFIAVASCLFAGFFSQALARAPQKPGISVRASLDKDKVTIGDKLTYSITIVKSRHIEVELPPFEEALGDFAVKDFGKKNRVFFGQEKITLWYLLDTFITGKCTIPKSVIKYRNKGEEDWSDIEAPEQEVEVKSLLSDSGGGLDPDVRDIKQPVDLPQKGRGLIIWGAVLLLFAGGLAAFYFLRKKKAEAVIPKKPAYQIAYEQLEALKTKGYIEQGKIQEYYVEISGIVRRYLENRFNLRAPEMTTEEFLANARDYSTLSGEHKSLLREFLLRCDLVKFARYAPSQEEIVAVFDSAKNFIGQTKDELS